MSTGKEHRYSVELEWTGNTGPGTSGYRSYERAFDLRAEGKPPILGSADPSFIGDAARWNPEDMLVGAVAACHQLWYLALCAISGVTVVNYVDHAKGTLVEDKAKGGYFTSVTLRPQVTISADSDAEKAKSLHDEAHEKCFIANSLNFPVACEPVINVASE